MCGPLTSTHMHVCAPTHMIPTHTRPSLFTSPLCLYIIEYDVYNKWRIIWGGKRNISNWLLSRISLQKPPTRLKKLKSFYMDRLYTETTWEDLGYPNNNQPQTEVAPYEISDWATSQPLSPLPEDLGDMEQKRTALLFAKHHKGSLHATLGVVCISTATALAPACWSISCSLAKCPQVHPSWSLATVPSCLVFSSVGDMMGRRGVWCLQSQGLSLDPG